MAMPDPSKVQLNLNVRRDGEGKVIESSMLINIRSYTTDEALALYKTIKGQVLQLHKDDVEPGTPDVSIGSKKCPKCEGKLVKRLARNGDSAGSSFWGCASYPKCRFTEAA
jgi:restriction system protein